MENAGWYGGSDCSAGEITVAVDSVLDRRCASEPDIYSPPLASPWLRCSSQYSSNGRVSAASRTNSLSPLAFTQRNESHYPRSGVNYIPRQFLQLRGMQPRATQSPIPPWYEQPNSDESRIPLRLARRPVRERAESRPILVHEVDEVFLHVVQARRQGLVFDYAFEGD